MSTPTLYRYYLLPEKGEGWAEIVVGSNGFFAAVSDYGNYAYRWTHFGDGDFREWVLRLDGDYVAGKIARRDVLDEDHSIEDAKRRVIEARRDRARGHDGLDVDEARYAWDDLADACGEAGLSMWYERHGLWPSHGFRYRYSVEVRCFVEKTLPRLKALIREELGGRDEHSQR